MKPSISWATIKWWIGLFLTLVVIILLAWNIILTKQLLVKMEDKSSHVTGYSTKRLDTMWMKINSIEWIIRTAPLVECGDHHEQRKIRESDK